MRLGSKIFIIFFLLVSFVCVATTAAHDTVTDNLDEYIDRLETTYESMKTLQAHFIQESRISALNRTERGEGVVYLKKGGKMLWEYKSPAVQKIILDGKNLWFYLPEENQVMKNDASRLPSDITMDLFSGKLHMREKFKISLSPQSEKDCKNIMLELIPRVFHPNLHKLTLWVDHKNFLIKKSSLENAYGNITVLEFFKIKVNKAIDDSKFIFSPPPGVEVFEPPPMQ